MAARLAWAVLPEAEVPEALRASRARLARTWMSALTLPVAVRIPLARAIDATALTASAASGALRTLAVSATRIIDTASRGELIALAERLASDD